MNALVRLVFKTARVRVDFDRDYGCEHKTGWSVALDGSYVVQLEPRLWRALWKAWRYAYTSNAALTGGEAVRSDVLLADIDGLAHEIFAVAQLMPGEGIEDAADRIKAVIIAANATNQTRSEAE